VVVTAIAVTTTHEGFRGAGDVGGLTGVLDFRDVLSRVRLAAVGVGEPVDRRQSPAGQQLPVPPGHVGILGDRPDGPADERRALGDGEVWLELRGVASVLLGYPRLSSELVEHELRLQCAGQGAAIH
jgi:hypothetical protein